MRACRKENFMNGEEEEEERDGRRDNKKSWEESEYWRTTCPQIKASMLE